MEHHENGRLDEAALLYKRVLAQAPETPPALFNLGLIHNTRMDFSEAIGCYRKLLALAPDHFQVLYYLANACRDEGLLAEAVGTYRKALVVEPGHADVLLNLGIAYYLQDNLVEAAACYEELLDVGPACKQGYYNLGLIRFNQQRLAEAIDCYENALEIDSEDVDTLFNLGLALQKDKRLSEAAERLETAIKLSPDDAEIYNVLGAVYKSAKELDQAESCFRRAIAIKPGYGEAWTHLAIVLHIFGRIDEAIVAYQQSLALGYNRQSAEYMLAALTGQGRESAPRQYVTELFDGYAANFDKSLTEELGYKVPLMLREALNAVAAGPFGKVLDLGCGTGLSGQAFRDISGHLSGIDLSSAMLTEARKKEIYDFLDTADLVEFLAGSDESYNLILAADVLIYLGDLRSFFKAVTAGLVTGGLLAFSVEGCDDSRGYLLRQSGRYAYHPDYIEELAFQHGFSLEFSRPGNIRQERGEWIKGYLYVMRRAEIV